MRTVLLLFIAVGICLSAAQAATPAPTWGASALPSTLSSNVATPASNVTSPTTVLTTVKVTKAPTAEPSVRTTAPTVTRTADPTLRATASRTPTPSSTTVTPTTRVITARPTTALIPTPTVTGTWSSSVPTPPPTPVPTTALPTPTVDPNLTATLPTVNVTLPTIPENNETLNFTVPTTWPYVTTTEFPTVADTPDIDPGMTPYTGPTVGTTPTDQIPVFDPNTTPTEDPMGMLPVFTAEVVSSPPFELPPGMLDIEVIPSPTETVEPVPNLLEPEEPGASSFLPRWLSYLLFIFLGISGVAGLALVGSYLGGRPRSLGPRTPPTQSPILRAQDIPLVLPETGELPIDQQILVDRISGFSPETMHVERLGRNLLRLEQVAQARSGDRSVRLGRLLSLSAVPSVAIPAAATAWARGHGFRILAIDGSGMALVMPALSSVNHSELGVLPVAGMVDGSSPVPMPIFPPQAAPSPDPRSSFLAGMGYYSSTEPSE